MATVTFEQASRIYPGTTAPAVDCLSLHIHDGEFLVLVGPSGCGKSTSLRMLAGLEEVDEGRILIGDHDITDVAPKDRDIAMVFQNYALYPHMSVAENMGFALKIAGVKKAEIAERVAEAATLLDLTPYLKRKPKALSGGQRQRVAMGRAIVRRPKVFLMDEPLSNLDAKLRVQTRTQIAQLQRRLDVTTVYVTHDQVEAMTMGDRVAVMNQGVLQQVAAPREMYDRPANLFVAGFIGSPTMNFMPMNLGNAEGSFELAGTVGRIARDDIPADGKITLGVRPEDLTVSSEGIPAEVLVVEELGADAFIFCSSPLVGDGNQLVARVDGRRPPLVGEQVRLQPAAEHVHVFASSSGERIEQLVAEPVVEATRPTVRPIRPSSSVPTTRG